MDSSGTAADLEGLREAGMDVRILPSIWPTLLVGKLDQAAQLLRLGVDEHQLVRVVFGPSQTVGQQTGMV